MLLEGQRIKGEREIQPDDPTAIEISRSGATKVIGSFKLCLTAGGYINSITMMRSTGYGAYDQKIQTKMHQWQYRPYMVNGRAVPVCTAVTFIYKPQ
jgi:hypothetical protein